MTAGLRAERCVWAVLLVLAPFFVACAKVHAPSSTTAPAPPAAAVSPPTSVWPFWQAPLFALRPRTGPASSSEDGTEPEWLRSDEVWRDEAGPLLARIRAQGLAIRPTNRFETGIGAFYQERLRRGAPVVITLDALFAMTHLALCRALAEVEERVERHDLLTMLHRLDGRLAAETGQARADLAGGYRLARSTVAIALALVDPSYSVPTDLADVVPLEIARIRAHEGIVRSPLFDVAIDYGAMSPRGVVAPTGDPAASMFQAVEWLGQAPFLFDARGESDGADIDVGEARTDTRAALLLARLLVPEGDATAAAAFARIDRLDDFIIGPADDLSPVEVARLARAGGIDPQWGADIANPTKVDHLRHSASRWPSLFDGSGSSRETGDGGASSFRPARSMRLVPLRGTPDSGAIERFVFPSVGALSPADARLAKLPAVRMMPSSLDVAATLGSRTASRLLASRGDLGYAGFDGAVSKASLPGDRLSRHGSVHSSGLDAIATWLRPSAAEMTEAPVLSDAHDRRKLETALVAWTLLRHNAVAFGHGHPHLASLTPAVPSAQGEIPGRVFVEPHPEAIASLLGTVMQAGRGLVELGALAGDSPSAAFLEATGTLLALALEGSVRSANAEPAYADLVSDLAQIPERMAALELRAGPAGDPVVIAVHLDVASGRVLEEGTGAVDEIFIRVLDPVAHRVVVAVGASIPHFEFVEPSGARRNDATWGVQLRGGQAPDRDSFIGADLAPTQ